VNFDDTKSGGPTLKEIADVCGVAISTVSRALTDPDRVRSATGERIRATAREMGYIGVSALGRNTTKGSIALIVPGLLNPVVLGLIRGAQSQIRAAGYQHVIVNTEESLQAESEQLAQLAQRSAGIIALAPRSSDDVLLQTASRVPLVVINRAVPHVSSVIIDTPHAMPQAIDHLMHGGHTTIAYVRGPLRAWNDRERFRALSAAATSRGVTLQPIGNYYPSLESGAAAADLLQTSGATAAIFFNDVLAIGALVRFKSLGVRVPEDISIIGCDDVFGASFCEPALTTFTSPTDRAGAEAADLIVSGAVQRGAPATQVVIPAHLTVRRSTAVSRTATS